MDYDKLAKQFDDILNSFDDAFIEEWLQHDYELELASKMKAGESVEISFSFLATQSIDIFNDIPNNNCIAGNTQYAMAA